MNMLLVSWGMGLGLFVGICFLLYPIVLYWHLVGKAKRGEIKREDIFGEWAFLLGFWYLYHQLYAEKQALARRYLKEKQGFDKI